MIRWPAFLFAVVASADLTAAMAEQVFLVVAASSDSPATIAQKARRLSADAAGLLVVDIRDCGSLKPMFAVVTNVAGSRDEANGALARIKASIADAYVKPCNVKPGSLLSFRISAVDPSIASVPSDVVNWEDADRVSTAMAIDATNSIAIIRTYAPSKDDPLEGRTERILLANTSGKRVTLSNDCTDFARPTMTHSIVVFECAREEAGEQLLHSVVVVTSNGRKITEIPHCRDPSWSKSGEIRCASESVTADGKLVLQEKLSKVEPN
jgi:hypothetical protein